MRFSNPDLWQDMRAEQHPHIQQVLNFAERWADTMEDAMSEGLSLAKVISPTLDECYTENDSAEVQDSAALVLRDCWHCGKKFFKIYAIATDRRSWIKQLKREDDRIMQQNKRKKKRTS